MTEFSLLQNCYHSSIIASIFFTEGSIKHTGVIPIAGDQVTNDIAMALRTPTQHAEDIKIKYACALAQLAKAEETIKVPSVGDRPARELSRQALAEVVEPRYDELFTLVQAEIRRSGYEQMLAGGIVLTGGTSKIEGAIELAEEIFYMPVRLGVPNQAGGLKDIVKNPIYSTGVGLLHYAMKQQLSPLPGSNGKKPKSSANALISTIGFKSTLLNTIPVSMGAGFKVKKTFSPV